MHGNLATGFMETFTWVLFAVKSAALVCIDRILIIQFE